MTARYLLYSAAWIAVFAAILFIAAGDVSWPQAWLFLVEYTIATFIMVVWLAKHDPELLRERFAMTFHRDQAVWDRLFFGAMMIGFVGWLVLIALDARRFGWSHVPVTLEAIGAFLFAACIYVTWLVFRVNTFAVPQARVQTSRKQTVISDGPYRFVRHPMYSGALLFLLGLPHLLGSWFGLLAAVPITIALSARAVGEEDMLCRDLDGYDAYAARVRWRIVPGLW